MKTTTTELETLTIENMTKASTIVCKTNPEWGAKRFTLNGQPLNDNRYAHTVGTGCNGKVLFEGEFHFWAIASYK